MTDADTRRGFKRRTLWVLLGGIAGALLAVMVVTWLRPHAYAGVVLQSVEPAHSMQGLVYDDGEPVDLTRLEGDVVLVYFGYTYCPDLCPAMLGTVSRAIESLGERGDRVTAMMVTVDPERDTLEELGEYVGHFGADIRGVWGSESDVRAVASGYGVTFTYDEPLDDGSYLVAHTATLFAVDPGGALRVVYPVELTAKALAADLREMLG